jgi:hypothetical protein
MEKNFEKADFHFHVGRVLFETALDRVGIDFSVFISDDYQ